MKEELNNTTDEHSGGSPCSAIFDSMEPDMSDEEIEALRQIGNDLGPHGLSDYQLELLCCRCIKVIYGLFVPLPPDSPWPNINWEVLYWRGLYPEKMKRKPNVRDDLPVTDGVTSASERSEPAPRHDSGEGLGQSHGSRF
jgi:hypothetical protein